MPWYRIRRTRVEKWEQVLRVSAPTEAAAIDSAENDDHIPPLEWRKVEEHTRTKVLEVVKP